MPYEVVKSELKYKGHIVDVTVDEITLPDGRTAAREVVIRGRAAAIVPINADGKVSLVRQYRHGTRCMLLEIPAGMVDDGEEPIDGALRELEEETGLIAGKMSKLIDFHVAAGYCTEIISIYLATELLQGTQHFDPDEFLELETYGFDELVDKIVRGEITDAKTIVGIMTAKEALSRR